MQSKKFSIGIDIGGTNTTFGIVNRKGEVVFQATLATAQYPGPEELLRSVHQHLSASIQQLGIAEFIGLGIGAPGANYYTGEITAAANLKWTLPVALQQIASSIFALPCTITNDAKAATIGEMTYGAAKGMKDFFLITLGTGVGSGFVAKGQLIYGHDGFAGELGHSIAIENGRECGCGRKGCLERYASASGMVLTAMEELDRQKNSQGHLARILKQKGSFTAHDIYTAATQGDPAALQTFELTGKVLGLSLANAVSIMSPQAIVFFGGPSRSGKLLLDPVKKHLEANLLSIYQDKVAVIESLLPQNDAAIIGAGALAWEKIR